MSQININPLKTKHDIKRHAGFTLLELSVVLFITGFLLTAQMQLLKQRALENHATQLENLMSEILVTNKAYYQNQYNGVLDGSLTPPLCPNDDSENLLWPPDSPDESAYQLLLDEGWLVADNRHSSLKLKWNYTADCRQLQLSYEVPNVTLARLLAGLLPATSIVEQAELATNQLTTTISPPSASLGLANFYLLDGSRALAGSMDGDGNDLLNVGLLQASAIRANQILHFSDIRLKTDSRPITVKELHQFQGLQPVAFRWITPPKGNNSDTTKTLAAQLSYGLIAQQVKQVMPHIVRQDKQWLALDQGAIIALLIAQSQHLQKRIKLLEQHKLNKTHTAAND